MADKECLAAVKSHAPIERTPFPPSKLASDLSSSIDEAGDTCVGAAGYLAAGLYGSQA